MNLWHLVRYCLEIKFNIVKHFIQNGLNFGVRSMAPFSYYGIIMPIPSRISTTNPRFKRVEFKASTEYDKGFICRLVSEASWLTQLLISM